MLFLVKPNMETIISYVRKWYITRISEPTVHTIESLDKEREQLILSMISHMSSNEYQATFTYIWKETDPFELFTKRFIK